MNLFKEIEKDPFDPEDFVEKLVRHTAHIQNSEELGNNSEVLDTGLLYDTFTKIISELKVLLEDQQKKCDQLATNCTDEEADDLQRVTLQHEHSKNALMMFSELDERIKYVAAKVIHLGDQLKSVDIPRSKLVEAQKLVYHFNDLCNPGSFPDEIFTDSSRITAAAKLMLKLNAIGLELPDDKFSDAKKIIVNKYDEVEKNLIDEFHVAHQRSDVNAMKELAHILIDFKGYNQAIDAFIERAQSTAFADMDMFQNAIPMCESNYQLVKHIFPNPEQIMAKFVLNLFSLKLQESVGYKLSDKSDLGKYLETLFELNTNAINTTQAMPRFELGNDDTYLDKLISRILQPHLDQYIRNEVDYLKGKCAHVLEQFYSSRNHLKKLNSDTGRFIEFRRDLQAVIGTRANINIGRDDFSDMTDSLVCEDVANEMLLTSKRSFQRCRMLSRPEEVSTNAVKLMEIILQYLLIEHIDYAVDLSLQSIPLSDCKLFPPILQFFQVLRKTVNVICNIDVMFKECVVPLVRGSPNCTECLSKERFALDIIENKLDVGMERTLNALCCWLKSNLPVGHSDSNALSKTNTMSACHVVVNKLRLVTDAIRINLDKKNCEIVLEELGVRFHRILIDNIFVSQFNMSEAYNAYIEITEYKRCAEDFHIPVVTNLFETLQALWKILMVPSGNLKQVCNDSQLADLDEAVISNFIMLRSDSKKNGNFLKGA